MTAGQTMLLYKQGGFHFHVSESESDGMYIFGGIVSQ